MTTINHLPVTVASRASMEHHLDEAVELVTALAIHERRRGVLVTRHGYGCFSVTLCDSVPYGMTHEREYC